MIKRIPSSLNIFTRTNKSCYVYFLIQYNRSSLSRDHQTVAIMNHSVKKVQYVISRLNALAKLQNVKEASRHPALMGNCPTWSHMPCPYQSTNWFVISPVHPFHVVYGIKRSWYFFLFYLGGYHRWHKFSFQTWLLLNMFSCPALYMFSSVQEILYIVC